MREFLNHSSQLPDLKWGSLHTKRVPAGVFSGCWDRSSPGTGAAIENIRLKFGASILTYIRFFSWSAPPGLARDGSLSDCRMKTRDIPTPLPDARREDDLSAGSSVKKASIWPIKPSRLRRSLHRSLYMLMQDQQSVYLILQAAIFISFSSGCWLKLSICS